MPELPGGFNDPEEVNSTVLLFVPKKRTRQSAEKDVPVDKVVPDQVLPCG